MVQFVVDVIVDPRGAVKGVNRVDKSIGRLQKKTSALGDTLKRAFVIAGTLIGIRQIARFTDGFTELNNRLRTVINDQQELNDTLEDLGRIANGTRQELGSVVSLYQRGSIAAKELGATQSQLLKFVERVGQGLAVQGGAASESAGALRQLSQALSSGVVRAEEFNSILEGAFPIAQAAARGIDKAGGSVARLRQLVVKGQISSREFFEGFLKGSDQLEEQFGRTVPTIGQAFTVLANNLTLFIGKIDTALGISGKLSEAIIAVSNSLGGLQAVIIGVSEALGPVFETFRVGFGEVFEEIFGTLESTTPTLRNFVTNVAVAFDSVVGVVRGTVLAAVDLFTNFGEVLTTAQSIVLRFGNTAVLAFQEIANGIAAAFVDPIGFILRGLNTIVSAAAGAAATAASLGIISEEARLDIEDIASTINITLDDLGARKPAPLPLFDTEETKRRIADLDTEVVLGFGAIGERASGAFREGFEQPTFAPLVDSLFAQAEEEAAAKAFNLGKEIKEATDEGTEGAGTTLAAGFATAFSTIKKEAEDLAAVSGAIVNSFADNATDALVQFAETGKFAFKDFATSIVADLLRIITRLLVVQAITAAVGIFGGGGAGPGGGGGLISTLAGGAGGFGGGRAGGGSVQPNRSFVVGENGPEVLQMGNQGGNIVPNDQLGGGGMSVTVVNVTDPNEIAAAISSAQGTEAVLNVISQNPNRVKQDVGV